MKFYSKNITETETIASIISSWLQKNDFVALQGDLGAGKTAFVRGIMQGFDYNDVSSPTFSIVHEYNASKLVFHMDWYRLQGEDDLYELGYEDYLHQNGIFLVEWSERAASLLPENYLEAVLQNVDADDTRYIELIPHGMDWQKRLLEKKKEGLLLEYSCD